MVKGYQVPPRSSWILYLALDTTILFSQLKENKFDPMMFEYLVGTLAVVLFTIKYGKKGWSKLETFCTVVVVISIIAFISFSSTVATIFSMIGITVATLPILKNVAIEKKPEDLRAWSSALMGSSLNTLDGQILTGLWFMILHSSVTISIIYNKLVYNKKHKP